MPTRRRQFQDIRSQSISRSHSLYSSSVYGKQKSQFNFLKSHADQCVDCINKKLTGSRKQIEKIQSAQQIQQHLQSIKRLNSIPDYQQLKRQRMLKQVTQCNKSMTLSQKQSIKQFKTLQNSQILHQISIQQKQHEKLQQSLSQSRKQLEQKYQQELRNQLKQDRSRKMLQTQRQKSQNPLQINRHKVIEQNDKWVNKINEQRKKCLKQNRKQIIQKSIEKFQEREQALDADKSHMKRVQQEFKSFTEFQPLQTSPYRKSRSVFSSQNNPQDVFTQLKRIQTQRKTFKTTQRHSNNQQRLIQLRKLEQQNRAKLQNKIASMSNYVQALTNQLLQKRSRHVQQQKYRKYYEPQKSKTDYYTEQLKKQAKPCHSCDKVLDSKYF